MKVACHILAYNVDRFLAKAIENSGRYVDKIYIVYPSRPWNYVPTSRENRQNPTTRSAVDQAVREAISRGATCQIEVIVSDFEREEQTRNDCLSRAEKEGYDWMVIQDADEFYTDSSWEILISYMRKNTAYDKLITPWYNFWKTPLHVLTVPGGSIKDKNVGFAIRISSGSKFERARNSTANKTILIDAPCFHYGYVMGDAEMVEKISTWGHSHQMKGDRWLRLKWLGWKPGTKNLHPVMPSFWPSAVRFPNEQPNFAVEFMDMEHATRSLNIFENFENTIYDTRTSLKKAARQLGKVVGKNML